MGAGFARTPHPDYRPPRGQRPRRRDVHPSV